MTDRRKLGVRPSKAAWKNTSTSPGPQHYLPRPWVGSFFPTADTKAGNCCQSTTNGRVIDPSKPRSYNTYSQAFARTAVICYLPPHKPLAEQPPTLPPIVCQFVLGMYVNLLLIIMVPQSEEQMEREPRLCQSKCWLVFYIFPGDAVSHFPPTVTVAKSLSSHTP